MASKRVEVVLSDKEPLQREFLQALAAITHPGGKTEFMRRHALRGLAALHRRLAAVPRLRDGSLDHLSDALVVDDDYRLFSTFLGLQAVVQTASIKLVEKAPAPMSGLAPTMSDVPVPMPAAPAARPLPNEASSDGPADWSRFKKIAGVRGKAGKGG